MLRRTRVVLSLALLYAGSFAAPASAAPPNVPCTTASQELIKQVPWTHQRLTPQRVWPLTRGQGVLVAVIDTGVDGAVPQLLGRVREGLDVVNGSGLANTDCFGHGTFVAGIIAAQAAGGTGLVGLAPGATILPIRQANGRSDGSAASLAASIRAAVDLGADVINVSASSFFPSKDLESAVKYAADQDVLLVAAVANQAQQGNPVAYPAAYPQVVAVGAIGPDGKRSEFSETGSYLDLVAPGVDVVSLSRGGRGHLVDSGTSFATPFVAATAALVRSYHPRLTAAEVKRRLELTADHPGTELPDAALGWGIVNPYEAVTALLAQEHGPVPAAQQRPIGPIPTAGPDPMPGRDEAIVFAIGALVVAVVGGLVAFLLPRGIRRGWRSVGEEPSPERPDRGARR